MVSDPSGPYKAGWGVYDVIKDSGLVVFGRNVAHLDAYTCKLIGKYPERVPYLRLATKEFGEWDKTLIDSTNPELRVMIKGPPIGQAI